MNLLDMLKTESIISNNLNLEFIEANEGFSMVRMHIDEKVLNPYGIVHGGATFTLADSAAGAASISLNSPYVTMDASINYLNPGTGKYLEAKGEVVYTGEKTCVVEINIVNDTNTLVAKGMFTMYKVDIEAF